MVVSADGGVAYDTGNFVIMRFLNEPAEYTHPAQDKTPLLYWRTRSNHRSTFCNEKKVCGGRARFLQGTAWHTEAEWEKGISRR